IGFEEQKTGFGLMLAWGAASPAWRAMPGCFGAVAPGACVRRSSAVYILLFHFLQPPERESKGLNGVFHQQQG
ncbi:hypothetical protein A2U01_0033628, partial [Trifolium medium]|nr:hypothetical protein [Trifolium medium]